MPTPSRFEIPLGDPNHGLPPLLTASVEADLQQLAQEICEYDPDLADILFGMTYPTATREQRLARISTWAGAGA